MVVLSAKCGAHEVLASGCLVLPKGEIAELTLPNGDLVSFEFDETPSERQALVSNATDTTLNLRLTGFDNPLGTASVTPFHIGEIDGREVFLMFAAHAIGGEDKRVRLLTYTFTLGAANG